MINEDTVGIIREAIRTLEDIDEKYPVYLAIDDLENASELIQNALGMIDMCDEI